MKKRSIPIVLFVLAILSVLPGCEKVIDLKLDNAQPQLVIYGGLSDRLDNHLVTVSKTYDFTDANRFNGVNGAKVLLKNEEGTIMEYVEVSKGVYQSPKFRGQSGRKYTLDVTFEGKTYTASSTMPGKVPLDSLTFKDFSFFGTKNTYVAANYNDPKGVQNQYRYILTIKGKVQDDAVSEDRFDDGNKISNVIFYDLKDLVHGDTINVEFQCIDRNVYKYFYSLEQNAGGGGPPVAPANPPSNFNNKALGVFNAYSVSKKTVVIK
ncbi:hypothetical protein CPT03_05070 [Pedobacter ginsengisoli]|uniref:DUF4249 domain-containing protein n=1 Tax=Pedobacter ginsengisoli TaxID=363852 RepID=A0A2D1U2P8_9SPHI|nr:DUF4249 domain-containing protein [Pedobacter ginsengisoli]ATP55878.1 hypothetical protein CPT03_05070 [Pedobacter ginsengisoli]